MFSKVNYRWNIFGALQRTPPLVKEGCYGRNHIFITRLTPLEARVVCLGQLVRFRTPEKSNILLAPAFASNGVDRLALYPVDC